MDGPIDREAVRRAFEQLDSVPMYARSEEPLEAHLVSSPEGDYVELRTAAGVVKLLMPKSAYEELLKWRPDAG